MWSIVYQDINGNPVSSPRDPAWHFTVLNGSVRTVKDGSPQRLVGGIWVNLPPN